MPLIMGKSKKSFDKNMESEMSSGKPKDQSLAIAYSVKRKAKNKKMAQGGFVDIDDKSDEGRSPHDSQYAAPIGESSPRSRARSSIDPEQESVIEHDDPHGIDAEYGKRESPSKIVGDSYPAKKSYAKGGYVDSGSPDEDSAAAYERGHADGLKLAQGGQVPDSEIEDHMDAHAGEEHDMKALERVIREGRIASPGPREYMAGDMADSYDDRDQSIADIILERKHMKMFAEGGFVNDDDTDDDMANMDRNAREEPNREDDMSFDALRKENYSEKSGLDALNQPRDSNEHGDDIDKDEHDKVSRIYSKMRSKRRVA